jgi:hypothetical protein
MWRWPARRRPGVQAAARTFGRGTEVLRNDEHAQAVLSTLLSSAPPPPSARRARDGGAGGGDAVGSTAAAAAAEEAVVVMMVAAWPSQLLQGGGGVMNVTVDGGKPGWRLALASSGLLTITDSGGGGAAAATLKHVSFAVASPTNSAGSMTFTIDRRLLAREGSGGGSSNGTTCKAAGPASTVVTMQLPGGDAAGSTVTGHC